MISVQVSRIHFLGELQDSVEALEAAIGRVCLGSTLSKSKWKTWENDARILGLLTMGRPR